MRVALIQLVSEHDVAANLETITSTAREAAGDGARLLVYPEAAMFAFGAPLGGIAEPLDGPFASAVQALARELGVTIVVGMFTPADAGRVFNTLLVAGGERPVGYDKIHLFDAFGFKESDTVAPGDQRVMVEVDGVPVGLTTCYDLRFPALFVGHAAAGAQVCVVSASWGAGPGKVEQWELLARARALDSTSVVLACGQARPGDARPAGRQRPHRRGAQPRGLAVRRGAGPARGRSGDPRRRPRPGRGRPGAHDHPGARQPAPDRLTGADQHCSALLTQVTPEVRHGEGDPAALAGVDQPLLEQRVARR